MPLINANRPGYIVELGLLLRAKKTAMLSCHFDESGGGKDSPVLVVAGFCGGVQQWDFFSGEWLAVLKSYGLRSPFKMQHFEKRKEQFRDFPEDQRKPLLSALLRLIEKRAMMAFGSVVSLPDYKELITGKVKERIGSAYALCVAGCFWCVGSWARLYGHNEPIAYVFDVGHKNSGDALQSHKKHYALEKFRTEYRLGAISFDDDTRAIPLQAADLFAYESWRRCTEKALQVLNSTENLTAEDMRYPIRLLFSSMKLKVRFLGRQALTELRDRYSS